MWEGLFMLLTLSTIMAIASFLAGILPLSFPLSPRQLRIVSLLGTGVLVGTSLIVIIPEGIETMYSAAMQSHAHDVPNPQPKIPSVHAQQKGVNSPAEYVPSERSETGDTSFFKSGAGIAPEVRSIIVQRSVQRSIQRTPPEELSAKERAKENSHQDQGTLDENRPQPQKGGDDDSTEGHKEGHTRVHGPEEEEEEEKAKPHEDIEGPHAYIGVALILGFILMFLIDHLPETLAPTRPKYQPMHISLSNLHRGLHNSSSLSLHAMNEDPASAPLTPLPHAQQQPRSSATTIGLVIHSCADGIALGASSTAPSTSLSFVIFFAIMLHKAPAAFGLTSVLLKQGLSKRTARTHLAFFSLAAPAGALLTWAIVHMLGRGRLGGDDGLAWTTGWMLLFSGGTFLYVAMHSMTEATTNPPEEPFVNGYIDHHSASNGLTKSDISLVMVGMLLPLLTQFGHAH
ncbi:ZIP metal ion transporter-like protein [Lentithecium fluviatile CBS 122367]|uniref:ZIP metal ion transporter-like protein n=1 Tax=Lentithecium fluviatile CBS 122367 TaxID=1168545 RepID=A0A6G1IEP2_9PLEO|nr:ZIP metal ion transporter-like protein [Lentithecium fluviatile CBS 122367]